MIDIDEYYRWAERNLGVTQVVFFYDFLKFLENRHLCHFWRPLVATTCEQTQMFQCACKELVTGYHSAKYRRAATNLSRNIRRQSWRTVKKMTNLPIRPFCGATIRRF
jgi:hypothetical protein